ncbi:MAG: DUF5915 domain-containing protein [Candidatus Shikimatogenerans bostrichidophilus]|nr:MAG: DUF5915 domain-containing protein [Candidatus Shikimatogenerans bostrichidophilus]
MLGPKYKKNIKYIEYYFNKIKLKDINKFEKQKYIYIKINNNKFKIFINEVYIKYIKLNKNKILYSKNDTIIILNTKINKKLKNECFIRDFINKIQKLRKK